MAVTVDIYLIQFLDAYNLLVYLIRNYKWLPSPLCECIVPEDGSPGMRLLVAMHDYHHG